VVDAAHVAKIRVAMCGEMAGDPMCCLILLGLELDELSMNHLAIPRIKRIIQESTIEEAKTLLKKAMSFNSSAEIRVYVQDYMMQRFPQELHKEED
jgi:phosphotransferase system enzyme I (PtsI)